MKPGLPPTRRVLDSVLLLDLRRRHQGIREEVLPAIAPEAICRLQKRAAEEVLALPMFSELTKTEIQCVVENIAGSYA